METTLVEVNREKTGTAADMHEFDAKLGPEPEIVLTKDGQVLPTLGHGVTMKVMKKKSADGHVTTVLETTANGQEYKVEIPNSETMSDTQLSQAIESELQKAGARVRVTMSGGRIDVEPLP